MKRIGILAAIFFGACIVFAFRASEYYPFLSDDSLISLRYVDRFLQGKGLTWTDGQRVEGYSNLLWILLVALLGRLGVDLIDAVRILGVACMSVVVVTLAHWYTHKDFPAKSYLGLVAGILFFCVADPVAVWAIGGLEQPLYAALIAISIPLTIQVIESSVPRRSVLFSLSLVLGLACITRPDGPLFSVGAFLSLFIGRFLANRQAISLRSLVVFASMPTVFYGGQLLFRLWYYGAWVPNTALVKIAPSTHHIENGAHYVFDGLLALFPFSALTLAYLIIAAFSPVRRCSALPLLIITLLWIPYVVFIGGDIFPAYRHFLPLIVVFSFAIVEGVTWLIDYLQSFTGPKWATMVTLGWLIGGAVSYMRLQDSQPENRRAMAERWEWDGQVVGLLLERAFSAQQPMIAVTAAGCLPYWSKLPALDMLGLNDYYLPRHPPADFGSGFLGHELGDPAYILGNAPDIIIFQVGHLTSRSRIGEELFASAEFHERYTPVNVEGSKPYPFLAALWFRKYSSKIGIQRTATRITVPGFLLNSNPNTIAYPNRSTGQLVVSVQSEAPVGVTIDSVTDTNWDLTIKTPNGSALRPTVWHEGTNLFVQIGSTIAEPIEIEAIELSRPADAPGR